MDDDRLAEMHRLLREAVSHIYNLEIKVGALENYILNAGKQSGQTLLDARNEYLSKCQRMGDQYKEWTDLLDPPKEEPTED